MIINIGGGFAYANQLKLFLIKNKKSLVNFHINTFDSFNYCKWNGGRYNRGVPFSYELLRYYNKKNIGVFVTFSNDVIDLSDVEGNQTLEFLNESPLNGAIIVNDDLRKHIRQNFKNLKISRSITWFESDYTPLDIEQYKQAEDLYDYIVPRRIDFINEEFIKNVHQEKYEIIITNDCALQCPRMHEHYKTINEYNRGENTKFIEECLLGDYHNVKRTNFTLEYIKSLGYSNFKISSRTNIDKPDDFEENVSEVL